MSTHFRKERSETPRSEGGLKHPCSPMTPRGDLGRAGGARGRRQRHRPAGRTWKSSTEGMVRLAVLRLCHCRSVSLVSELSSLAACSSWKFLIKDRAP